MGARLVGLAVVAVSIAAFGQESDDRQKIIGTWQLQTATGSPGETWVFEDKGGKLHVSCTRNSEKFADFECNTTGGDCATKVNGRDAKVSMWFNGAKLVQLETRGSDVIKRHFAVAGEGEAMELEVIPVVPSGKPEVFRFKRVQLSTGRQ
jgi:hypothetical protein